MKHGRVYSSFDLNNTMHDVPDTPMIQRLKEFFSARDDIALAILYGSFTSGKAGKTSDVDIAIAGGPGRRDRLSLEKRLELQGRLSLAFDREVDLVDLAQAQGLFLHRIITGGRVIKDSVALRLALQKEALYFMADTWPILKRDQAIRVRKMFTGETHGS